MRFTTLCVRFKTDKFNGTKRCSLQRNFMKTMCTYMDRCRCAVVIWLWHKFLRLWGKLCAMRWGKIIGCGVSYHPYSNYKYMFSNVHTLPLMIFRFLPWAQVQKACTNSRPFRGILSVLIMRNKLAVSRYGEYCLPRRLARNVHGRHENQVWNIGKACFSTSLRKMCRSAPGRVSNFTL